LALVPNLGSGKGVRCRRYLVWKKSDGLGVFFQPKKWGSASREVVARGDSSQPQAQPQHWREQSLQEAGWPWFQIWGQVRTLRVAGTSFEKEEDLGIFLSGVVSLQY
jgi:hypothetical protein